jgi:hypothetical protein
MPTGLRAHPPPGPPPLRRRRAPSCLLLEQDNERKLEKQRQGMLDNSEAMAIADAMTAVSSRVACAIRWDRPLGNGNMHRMLVMRWAVSAKKAGG